MNVKQKFSILVLPKWKKTDSQGMTPIYLRITIDDLEDELSVGCKVLKQYWDSLDGAVAASIKLVQNYILTSHFIFNHDVDYYHSMGYSSTPKCLLWLFIFEPL